MNGELAQAVVVVAHANVALAADGDLALADHVLADHALADHLAFRYSPHVVFEADGRVVESADGWVTWLRTAGIDRLWLLAGGRQPVAFADQGRWGILAPGRGAWFPGWDVADGGWDVAYGFHPEPDAAAPPVDLEGSDARLAAALDAAAAFARREEMGHWADLFTEARTSEAEDDLLLPSAGWSPGARRLLARAGAAWVFGGMGSWNDVGFADDAAQIAYDRVSADLYEAIITAVRDATNAFRGS